jgi:phospholipid N-methyltransferase
MSGGSGLTASVLCEKIRIPAKLPTTEAVMRPMDSTQAVILKTTDLKASMISPKMLFLRNFLKHPATLGSVVPSSRFVTERLLRKVDFHRARLIVEYGPGIGNISSAVINMMHRDACCVLIEVNPDFVRHLSRVFAGDKRVRVIQESAANVEDVIQSLGFEAADYVISGIPFSTMPEELRFSILAASNRVLRKDGRLLVYQFRRSVLPDLASVFSSVDEEFEPRNVLPARLFYCQPKPSNGASARASARVSPLPPGKHLPQVR